MGAPGRQYREKWRFPRLAQHDIRDLMLNPLKHHAGHSSALLAGRDALAASKSRKSLYSPKQVPPYLFKQVRYVGALVEALTIEFRKACGDPTSDAQSRGKCFAFDGATLTLDLHTEASLHNCITTMCSNPER